MVVASYPTLRQYEHLTERVEKLERGSGVSNHGNASHTPDFLALTGADIMTGPLKSQEQSTPGTVANVAQLYAKDVAGVAKMHMLWDDGTETVLGAGGGSGHVIEESGTPLTARANLNFTSGLLATDNTPDTEVALGPLTADWTQGGVFNILHAGRMRLGVATAPTAGYDLHTTLPIIVNGVGSRFGGTGAVLTNEVVRVERAFTLANNETHGLRAEMTFTGGAGRPGDAAAAFSGIANSAGAQPFSILAGLNFQVNHNATQPVSSMRAVNVIGTTTQNWGLDATGMFSQIRAAGGAGTRLIGGWLNCIADSITGGNVGEYNGLRIFFGGPDNPGPITNSFGIWSMMPFQGTNRVGLYMQDFRPTNPGNKCIWGAGVNNGTVAVGTDDAATDRVNTTVVHGLAVGDRIQIVGHIGSIPRLNTNVGVNITTSVAATDTVNATAHVLAVGQLVTIAGHSVATLNGSWWVVAVPTADSFQVSATEGGAVFDIPADGTGGTIRTPLYWYVKAVPTTTSIQLANEPGGTVLNIVTAGTGGLIVVAGSEATGVISLFEHPVKAPRYIVGDLNTFGDSENELLVQRVYKDFAVVLQAVTTTGNFSFDALTHTHGGATDVVYAVEVDLGGNETVATVRWSDDGGATWDVSGIAIGEQIEVGQSFSMKTITLQNGITIKFTPGTYTLGDRWAFTAIAKNNQAPALRVDTKNAKTLLNHELIFIDPAVPTNETAKITKGLAGSMQIYATQDTYISYTILSVGDFTRGWSVFQGGVNKARFVTGGVGLVHTSIAAAIGSKPDSRAALDLQDTDALLFVNRVPTASLPAVGNGLFGYDSTINKLIAGVNGAYRTVPTLSEAHTFTALQTFGAGISVTGDITVTGNVDGVDVSGHAANANAHVHTDAGHSGKIGETTWQARLVLSKALPGATNNASLDDDYVYKSPWTNEAVRINNWYIRFVSNLAATATFELRKNGTVITGSSIVIAAAARDAAIDAFTETTLADGDSLECWQTVGNAEDIGGSAYVYGDQDVLAAAAY